MQKALADYLRALAALKARSAANPALLGQIEAAKKSVVQNAPGKDLARLLGGTTWTWPDTRNIKKENAWFRLNDDGSTTAGWHARSGTWKALSGDTIELSVTFNPGTGTVRFNRELSQGEKTDNSRETYKRVK